MNPASSKTMRSRATTPARATCSQPAARRMANVSRLPSNPAPRPSSPRIDRSWTVTSWPSRLSSTAANKPASEPPTIAIRIGIFFCGIRYRGWFAARSSLAREKSSQTPRTPCRTGDAADGGRSTVLALRVKNPMSPRKDALVLLCRSLNNFAIPSGLVQPFQALPDGRPVRDMRLGN